MTQETALGILKTGASVFLTGSAGTGKTYVLNQYVDFLKRAGVVYAVTASTGIAATHIGGMTIHSWSGLGIKNVLTPYDIDLIESKQYLYKRLTKTQVLIVDEVSMLHASQLSMLDMLLRSVRKNESPFGGMQVIFCGDFFQLPPIVKQREVDVADFVFTSPVWRELDPVVCYLTHQYRQNEGNLLLILEAIRSGDLDDGVYELLEARKDKVHELPFTRLYTHTLDVDAENLRELEKLNTEERVFTMTSSGKDALVLGLIKNCLAPEILKLRIGARVMFVKNDPEYTYMNGTLGTVTGYSKENLPIVLLENGKTLTVSPVDWSLEEDGKVRASINQIPLRLAWAITIHKSQGMSLDRAEIDLSKAFTFGQGYVALSRLRTLEGISLSGFSQKALMMHPEVMEYDRTLRELSDLSEHAFETFTEDEKLIRQKNFVTRVNGTWPKEGVLMPDKKTSRSTYEETKLLLQAGETLEAIVKERDLSMGTILKHLEVLKEQDELPALTHLNLIDLDRLPIILDVFKQLKTDKLTPVFEYLKKADFDVTYDEVRIARLFVSH
jgi:ATP-dependent DNA helicase PIF1